MARLFDDGSSQYLINASAPVSAAPVTFAAWVQSDDTGSGQDVLVVGDVAGNNFFRLYIDNDRVYFRTRSAAANNTAFTGIVLSDNTWHHMAGVSSATDSRYAYADGTPGGENTTDITPAGLVQVSIAFDVGSAYLSGMVAEAAIWNVALIDPEVADLSRGISPLLIRPANLVAYWPLLDNDNEWQHRYDMTPTNGPGWAGHPPQVFQRDKQLWKPARLNNTRQIWAMS